MKTLIDKIDFKRVDAPEFSRSEVLQLTGYSEATLKILIIRGFVPQVRSFTKPDPGDEATWNTRKLVRAPRRKYSTSEVIYLHIFKQLSRYISQLEAAAIAINIVPLVVLQFWLTWTAESDSELPQTNRGQYVVIAERGDGKHSVDLVGTPDSEFQTAEDLVRARGFESALVLNVFAVASKIFGSIADVRAQRGAPTEHDTR